MEKKMGFTAACKAFFELKPGQTIAGFREEMKALTPKDRLDIYDGFCERNPPIVCEPPSAPPSA